MLKVVSFFNLIFSVVYFLVFLQGGNGWVVLGLLAVIVFNWLVIRSLETGQMKWTALHWALTLPDVSFGLFMAYGQINLLIDAITYNDYAWSTIRLIAAGLVFAGAVILQVFLSCFALKLKKTD